MTHQRAHGRAALTAALGSRRLPAGGPQQASPGRACLWVGVYQGCPVPNLARSLRPCESLHLPPLLSPLFLKGFLLSHPGGLNPSLVHQRTVALAWAGGSSGHPGQAGPPSPAGRRLLTLPRRWAPSPVFSAIAQPHSGKCHDTKKASREGSSQPAVCGRLLCSGKGGGQRSRG